MQGLCQERQSHINILEMKAVCNSFTCFSDTLWDHSILLSHIYVAQQSYVNKEGGTGAQDLSSETAVVWELDGFLCTSYPDTRSVESGDS